VNDRGISYGTGKHRMVFFNSFEEEEEYNAKKILQQNPVERIRETVQLILRAYGFTEETLRLRKCSNEIFIDKE
jgi:hypothetical protein